MEKTAPGKKHGAQMNSVVRAMKLIQILQSGSDLSHPLSQKEILDCMKKVDARCTEKTVKTDLRNLMKALNPLFEEYTGEDYEAEKGKFKILYDGVEEARHRISGVRFIHKFTNDELETLVMLVKGSNDFSPAQVNSLEERIKSLGSGFYTYSSDAISNIPQHSTIDKTCLKKNLWVIKTAITNNVRISFTFNHYDREGNLTPVRKKRYTVNPFYVVIYGQKYYLLCTVSHYENVQIYRLDLMTDMELSDAARVNIREVPELEHSSAREYMLRHPNMYFDAPRTIQLKVEQELGYNCLHDLFGDEYTVKEVLDEKYDKVEVVCSEAAMVDWAIQFAGRIEVIRPLSTRKKIKEKAKQLMEMYK